VTGRRPYLAEAAFAEYDEEIEVGGADEVLLGNAVDRPRRRRDVVVGRATLARSLQHTPDQTR